VTKACCTELIASSSDNPVVSTSSPVLTMHALSTRATIAPDAHRTVVVMPLLHLFHVFVQLPKLGAISESHIVFGEGASSAIASLTLGRLRVHVHASGDRCGGPIEPSLSLLRSSFAPSTWQVSRRFCSSSRARSALVRPCKRRLTSARFWRSA